MAALKIQKFSLTLASHWLALYWHLFCVVCVIFVEELFQFQSRYNRNISRNLLKQCFSGISLKPFVFACALINVLVVVPCALMKDCLFGLEDVISILSGISVGPLVEYLLNLN